MWILTENGNLVNLVTGTRISSWDSMVSAIVTSDRGSDIEPICSCKDYEHGQEIVRKIADQIGAINVVKLSSNEDLNCT